MAINPYAPPGAGGPPGSAERPPRPLWETVAILLCGLSLIPFLMPESYFTEIGRLLIGLTAIAVLAWIAHRRLKAMRGMLSEGEAPKLGEPKPYHVERKFKSPKR